MVEVDTAFFPQAVEGLEVKFREGLFVERCMYVCVYV
jgi:hypothetical protein